MADIYYILHRSLHSEALTSPMSDFEDAMLAETAYKNNIDFIVTRNLKDYVKSEVPACLPSEILEKINIDK